MSSIKRAFFSVIVVFIVGMPNLKAEGAPSGATPVKLNLTVDQIILEEYKAVRAEINQCLQNRVSILSLGFAALGAIVAGGISVSAGEKPKWIASALIIGIGATLTSLYVCNLWTEESQRLQRASFHNYYLETKMKALFPDQVAPLEWEHLVRTDAYKPMLPTDSGTPKLFLYASGAFALAGFVLFGLGISAHQARRWAIPVVVVLGALLWYFEGFSPRHDQMNRLGKCWDSTPALPCR